MRHNQIQHPIDYGLVNNINQKRAPTYLFKERRSFFAQKVGQALFAYNPIQKITRPKQEYPGDKGKIVCRAKANGREAQICRSQIPV